MGAMKRLDAARHLREPEFDPDRPHRLERPKPRRLPKTPPPPFPSYPWRLDGRRVVDAHGRFIARAATALVARAILEACERSRVEPLSGRVVPGGGPVPVEDSGTDLAWGHAHLAPTPW